MIPTSRAAIIATQDTYLRALLIAIDGRNPFYTAKMRAAGLRGADCDRAKFLAKFPFTTKAELVADHAAHAPFGSNLTFPVERYVRYSQTSGSTGLPLRWLDTAESWTWMLDSWTHFFQAGGALRVPGAAGENHCAHAHAARPRTAPAPRPRRGSGRLAARSPQQLCRRPAPRW